MTKPHSRSRLERSAPFAILFLPVLFSCLGTWQLWRDLAILAEGRGEAADVLVAQLRLIPAGLTLLSGLAAAIAGLAGLAAVARSARQGVASRPALVSNFRRLSRILPALLVVQIAGLVLAMLGAAVFEASGLWSIPHSDDKTGVLAFLGLVYAGAALWGGFETLRGLRRAVRLFTIRSKPIDAIRLAEADAPGLFALLRELAGERGTTVPDVVMVGLGDSFFVCAFPIALPGPAGEPRTVVHGRHLHIPLHGIAAMDRMELRTVLAHELAHFSGEDTGYSQQFTPLYIGLGQGAEAMSVRRTDWGSTYVIDRMLDRVVHPHTILAVEAYTRFDHVVAQWSRLRELEADRAAVQSGSGPALASALLRLGLIDTVTKTVLQEVAARPDTAPADIPAAVAAGLGQAAAGDPASHLGDHAPHPTDSHPPSRQRIEAAAVPIDDALMARAARPVSDADADAVRALFTDWAGLSQRLSATVRDAALGRLQAHRAQLLQTAREAGPELMALHGSLVRPLVTAGVFSLVCLVVSVGCVLSALYGGKQDQESWPLLGSFAAAGVVGLGFALFWTVRVWVKRKVPYLVLSPEGMQSPGFTGTLRWLDVTGISVSAVHSLTWFRVRDGVALPVRTGRLRRLQLDTKRHAVQFSGVLPRGLSAAAFQAVLMRYAKAAHARDRLDEAA